MKRKSSGKRASSNIHLGFQIAPMIDVVFVILLFFMVAAGKAQKETALPSQLPSPQTTQHSEPTPDPVEIRIDESGQVYLNEEALDDPESKRLPGLTTAVRDIKQTTSDAESTTEFLISTDDHAKYQRVVDVMDVLAREKITRVTFQSGE